MINGLINKAKGLINSWFTVVGDWWRLHKPKVVKYAGRFVIFISKTIIEVLLNKWL